MSQATPSVDPAYAADEAAAFLVRAFARAGLRGTLVPRIVNPRTHGWIFGFAHGVGDAFGWGDADRYRFEAQLFVAVYDGSPMGQQLGLEALSLAHQLGPAGRARMDGFTEHERQGREAAPAFLAWIGAVAGLDASFAPAA